MKKGRLALAFAGILLFAFILSTANLSEVAGILFSLDPTAYAVAVALLIFLVFLKSAKWNLILKSQGNSVGFLCSVSFFFIGLFLGIITPGRLGDFAKAVYLKRESVGLSAGILSIVLDRLVDVGVLVFFSFFAGVFFIFFFGISIVPVEFLLILVVLFIAGVFFFLQEKMLRVFLRPFFNFFIPARMKKKVSESYSNFFLSLRKIRKNPAPFMISILLGIVNWGIAAVIFWLFAVSLSIDVPLAFMFLITPLVSLLDLIPVSISGLGTRDATLIFLFSFFAVSVETAIAFSLLVFFTNYLLIAAIGLALFLLNPISLSPLLEE